MLQTMRAGYGSALLTAAALWAGLGAVVEAKTPQINDGCDCDDTAIAPPEPRSMRLNIPEPMSDVSPTSEPAGISPASGDGMSIGPKMRRTLHYEPVSEVAQIAPALKEVRLSTKKERVASLSPYSGVSQISPAARSSVYIAPKEKRPAAINWHRTAVGGIAVEEVRFAHVVPAEESAAVEARTRRHLPALNPYEGVASQMNVGEAIRRSSSPRQRPSSVASHVQHPAGIAMSMCTCADHANHHESHQAPATQR